MATIPSPRQPLPVWYQKDDLTYIFRQLRAGEFCSLVGMGSAGKSNLVNLVARDDVREHYIPREEAMSYVIVMLNPHLLISLSDDARYHTGHGWAGYEMMISRLRRKLISQAFYPHLRDAGREDVIKQIDSYYAHLFDKLSATAQTGVRQVENALYEVMALGEAWRVTFIFDEFEQFIATLPPDFFQSLRGLRDEYKGRVMYVTTSRRPLWELTDEAFPEEKDRLVMEGFVELFHGGMRYVSPLDLRSASETARRLGERYNVQLDGRAQENLISVTGGHAGMLRRGFVPTMKQPDVARDAVTLINLLLDDRGLSDECGVLLRSLPPGERRVLRQLLDNEPVTDTMAWKSLVDKHIVYEDNGRKSWLIPLLAGWARKHKAEL
ncbi:MAG: hypothetical protein SGI73_04375 [Chloroflexota bacterium]|nr:hypothetical protein [Chloroflexota bacterium]